MAWQGGGVAGIDVGGTFTDLLIYETGSNFEHVRLAKIPTTAGNQADGVLGALAAAGARAGAPRPHHSRHHHHHQRRAGAQGSRKVRPHHHARLPRHFRSSAAARGPALRHDGHLRAADPASSCASRSTSASSAAGEVLMPLDAEAVARLPRRCSCGRAAKAFVIHFLHAYANPVHELAAGEIAARALAQRLRHARTTRCCRSFASTSAAPRPPSTPPCSRSSIATCGGLTRRARRAQGFSATCCVMNGNGGTVAARLVAREAAKTIMSGPASGCDGARPPPWPNRAYANAITYDMGGTVHRCRAHPRRHAEAAGGDRPSTTACRSTCRWWMCAASGRGGGSIAAIDAAGMLEVGPHVGGLRARTHLLWPRRPRAHHHRRQPGAGPA